MVNEDSRSNPPQSTFVTHQMETNQMKEQSTPDYQSARRYTAICGRLSGKSLEDIAAECDISTRTLYRWMECPQFIQEYENAHQKFLDRVEAKLHAAADRAA